MCPVQVLSRTPIQSRLSFDPIEHNAMPGSRSSHGHRSETPIRQPEEDLEEAGPSSTWCAPTQLPLSPSFNEELDRQRTFQDEMGGFDGTLLARSGFFYDRRHNNVECFSCGVKHRFSDPNNQALYRHLPECDFANGRDRSNVPIQAQNARRSMTAAAARERLNQSRSRGIASRGSETAGSSNDRNRTEMRGSSFAPLGDRNQSTRPQQQVASGNRAAATGNLNQGATDNRNGAAAQNGDRYERENRARGEREVEREIDAEREVPRARQQPQFIVNGWNMTYERNRAPFRNFAVAAEREVEPRPAPAQPQNLYAYFDPASRYLTPEERQRVRQFPCENPRHPEMRSVDARVRTFGRGWQPFHTDCSPREIAEAGFYYIGPGDQTLCWYCGGGLENWRRNDNPWTEHARWHPICEHLLQQRGLDFVQRTTREHANMPRRDVNNRNPAAGNQNANRRANVRVANPNAGNARPNTFNLFGRGPIDNNPNEHHHYGPMVRNVFINGNGGGGGIFHHYAPPGRRQPRHGGVFRPSGPPPGMNVYPRDLAWERAEAVSPGGTRHVEYRAQGVNFTQSFRDNNNQQPSRPQPQQQQQGEQQNANDRVTFRQAMQSNIIDRVREVGFLLDDIEAIVRRRINTIGTMFGTAEEMIEELLQPNEQAPPVDASRRAEPPVAGAAAQRMPEVESGPANLSSLQPTTTTAASTAPQAANASRGDNVCRQCRSRPSNRVFLPCGHLITCSRCGNGLDQCPSCGARIENHVDVNER